MTITPTVTWVALVPDMVCPLPVGLSHNDARAAVAKVRKEKPGLSDSAYRREAARQLNLDYDTFLKAWKTPGTKLIHPKPYLPTPPPPHLPTLPKPLSHLGARDMYDVVRREMPGATTGQIRREAAKRLGVSYDDYLKAWKKSAAPVYKPLPPIPPEPFTPPIKPPVPAPKPNVPTHDEARETFKRFKKENPGLGDAELRRKAAEHWDMPYKDYLQIWKKPTNTEMHVEIPSPLPRDSHGWQRKPANPSGKALSEHSQISVGADLDGINPHFSVGDKNYRMNCPSTTSSFEMSRRGNMVTSIGMPNGASIDNIYKAWDIKLENQVMSNHDRQWASQGSPWARNTAREIQWQSIPSLAQFMPDGARGFISVVWKGDKNAHIYNWEKINGKIEYFDAQSGRILGDGIERFKQTSKNRGVYMARVDDLPTPSPEKLNWLVRNRSDADIIKRDQAIAKKVIARDKRREAVRAARYYTDAEFNALSASEKAYNGRLPGESMSRALNRQGRERSRAYYAGK